MDALVLRLFKSREDIDAEVFIKRGQDYKSLGCLYALELKDVKQLIRSNSSDDGITPFAVEVR